MSLETVEQSLRHWYGTLFRRQLITLPLDRQVYGRRLLRVSLFGENAGAPETTKLV